ncbi:ABC transporter permease [uncultured Flavobacterium sp.]|mgnify:CR=1 FL=1|uniref:ABC transporter permease n=1 Tax=uncultured Flavobacterium sp. TaxID=165435 RepID=UPI0025EA6B09|nr:ABC transporter permease [uncultured Flavobacterium sp.]
MLKNWLKIYLHQLKNNKFFTALNVLGLSIGISGLIFSILYWNEENSYNDWNPEKEKVYQVQTDIGDGMIWNTNVAPLEYHLKTFPELENYCYFKNFYQKDIIEYKGKKEMVDGIINSQKSFFSFFPFEFTRGNRATALPDDGSIAISEKTAQQLFGNEEPLGKQVLYSGKNLVVRGVYKNDKKSSIAPEAVVNAIDKDLLNNKDQWGNFSYGLLVKLKKPQDTTLVKKKIDKTFYEEALVKWAKEEGISPQEFIKKRGQNKTILSQLKTARLHSPSSGFPEGAGNYQFLLIMIGLSVLILILSITNYVNLATANAIKRAKEVGVRKIIGASKGNIIKQFLFETIITSSFAILLALVIVELSLPYYNEFLKKELIIYGSQFYLQLILIFIVVIATAGIFPAVYVANFETLKVLKGNFGRSKNGVWLRNGMLILQFAIASFFIIGSYIVYEQVKYMSSKDLGFKGDQVIDVTYRRTDSEDDPKVIYNKYYTIQHELMKIKGVENVATGAFSFGNSSSSSSNFSYKSTNVQSQNMPVDFEMLDMMEIKIVQGRNFSPNLASDTISSVLLNETAVRMINEKNPIGKEITWNDKKLKIVGIVKDFHLYGLQAEIPPMTFFHFKTVDWMAYNIDRIHLKIAPENMEETIANIEKFWTANVDSKYPFEYNFVDKNFARTYQSFVNQRNLFALLNGIVILIALFGLFALASYTIQRRMKEIAIRKTLGAETKTLLKELSKQYLIFCIIGFFIALFPAYYLLNKWLENFAFRIDITILPFIIGFFALLILTLVVVLSRAYQATRANVLKYLKYE